MKKTNQVLGILSIILITSCASVKIGDTWKSDDFDSVVNEKILIVAKAKDANVSKSYEIEIANKLRAKGMSAIERHIKYPSLKDDAVQTQDEINNILQQFKNDGINGVLVTALKDVKVKKKIISDDKMSYLTPTDKSFISFRAYNFDANSQHKMETPEAPRKPTVLRSKTYFLEAVTYNLSLEDKKRLVGILQADITDLEDADKVLEGFSKLVVKQFNK